jgi:hypothetical protein
LLDEASKILHSNDKPAEEPAKEESQQAIAPEVPVVAKAPVLKQNTMIKTGVRKQPLV